MAILTATLNQPAGVEAGTQETVSVVFSHSVSLLSVSSFSYSSGVTLDSVTPITPDSNGATDTWTLSIVPYAANFTLTIVQDAVEIVNGDTATGPTALDPIILRGTATVPADFRIPPTITVGSPDTYDPELSEAIKEAYASVPDNQIFLETLEFIHNSFYYTSDVSSPDYYNRNEEGYYLPYLENVDYPYNVLDVNNPLAESEFLLLLDHAGNDEVEKIKIKNKYRKRTSIRVVNDRHDLDACILHGVDSAGDQITEEATFLRFAFELKLPEVDDAVSKEFVITMDNVSGAIGEHIDVIKGAGTSVTVIYRPYLVDSDDVSTSETTATILPEPQIDPPYVFVVRSVSVNVHQVEATCTFGVDFTDTPFPNRYYTIEEFPGLS